MEKGTKREMVTYKWMEEEKEERGRDEVIDG
jgi:hypothetical protein